MPRSFAARGDEHRNQAFSLASEAHCSANTDLHTPYTLTIAADSTFCSSRLLLFSPPTAHAVDHQITRMHVFAQHCGVGRLGRECSGPQPDGRSIASQPSRPSPACARRLSCRARTPSTARRAALLPAARRARHRTARRPRDPLRASRRRRCSRRRTLGRARAARVIACARLLRWRAVLYGGRELGHHLGAREDQSWGAGSRRAGSGAWSIRHDNLKSLLDCGYPVL